MSQIIKVKANAEGRYPFKLYGTEFELEPIKGTSKSEPKDVAPKKPDTSPETVGQPLNDNPSK